MRARGAGKSEGHEGSSKGQEGGGVRVKGQRLRGKGKRAPAPARLRLGHCFDLVNGPRRSRGVRMRVKVRVGPPSTSHGVRVGVHP